MRWPRSAPSWSRRAQVAAHPLQPSAAGSVNGLAITAALTTFGNRNAIRNPPRKRSQLMFSASAISSAIGTITKMLPVSACQMPACSARLERRPVVAALHDE